jgi:hypothetical protein
VVTLTLLRGEEASRLGEARGQHGEQAGVPRPWHVGEDRQARVKVTERLLPDQGQ